MQALLSPDEIRDVNTRYHDVAAASYDAKWGIDFGDVGRDQVLGKLRKLVGSEKLSGPAPAFARGLEIGAGTGYFSLNLMRAGVLGEVICTDISPGMVTTLAENARRLGLDGVSAIRAEAQALPFPDQSFDIVLGHAVLHHLPDLEASFAEFHRVLRPGGLIVFAGEPSRLWDRIARAPKNAARWLAPLWRAAIRADPAPPEGSGDGPASAHDHQLEVFVDIHTFAPAELEAIASSAGFDQVRVRGEELLANWFGWFNRALEASADPAQIPTLWRQYAFHGYLTLQSVDERALEPRLPPAIFYNLLLSGRRT
jgi:SAM-dependent methyltransferase